LITSDVTLLTR